jgi:MFS family permease
VPIQARGNTLAYSSTNQCVPIGLGLAGGFMPPLDFVIVNFALSLVLESSGANPAQLQPVISGYGVFLITGGWPGDLYGRAGYFLIGMAGSSLAGLVRGLATSPTIW